MNWTDKAIYDLNSYDNAKKSITNMSLRINELEELYTSISGNMTERERVQGSNGRTHEDYLVDNIVERELLAACIKYNEHRIQIIDDTLNSLDETEAVILREFYINREKGHVERLIEILHIENSHIYRLKSKALDNFTRAMYGLAAFV